MVQVKNIVNSKTGSKLNNKESIQKYMPLVRSIAKRISYKLPKNYDLEDLVSDGVVGLLSALERYDPSRGVKFETFATYYIKGAILDNLPKLPTSTVYQDSVNDFNQENYTDIEDYSEEDIETESAVLYNKVTQLSYSYILSLDAPTGSDGDESFNLLNQLGKVDSIHRDLEFEELQKILRLSIEQLPYQERVTLKYYYFEGLPFNEIGKILNLSESWVSRIHKRALEQLRVKLGKRKCVDDFISSE